LEEFKREKKRKHEGKQEKKIWRKVVSSQNTRFSTTKEGQAQDYIKR